MSTSPVIKKYFGIALLFVSTISYAQFAIISDKDGFVNVRNGGNPNSKVTDSLQNGHLVYCLESKGNWTNIDYTKNGKELNGYVYKDRYKLVNGFLTIHVVTESETSVRLKRDSVEIIVTQTKFDKSRHKFKYFKDAPEYIELIDNKKYWGTDGEMPKTQFDKIMLKIGRKSIILPTRATESLYESSLESAEVYYDKEGDAFYITTMNSDGAGYYEVIWEVKKGVYKDRLIVYGF